MINKYIESLEKIEKTKRHFNYHFTTFTPANHTKIENLLKQTINKSRSKKYAKSSHKSKELRKF